MKKVCAKRLTLKQAEGRIEEILKDEPNIRRETYPAWRNIYESILKVCSPSAILDHHLEEGKANLEKIITNVRKRLILISGTLHKKVFQPYSNLPYLLRNVFMIGKKELTVFAGPDLMDRDTNPLYNFLKEAEKYHDPNISVFWARNSLPLHATIVDDTYVMYEAPHTEKTERRVKFVYKGNKAKKVQSILYDIYISDLYRKCIPDALSRFGNYGYSSARSVASPEQVKAALNELEDFLDKRDLLEGLRENRKKDLSLENRY